MRSPLSLHSRWINQSHLAFPHSYMLCSSPLICLEALLDSLQNAKVFLVMRRTKLGTILQILHRYQREGEKHFPQAGGYILAIIAPYATVLRCCKGTLLTHVQPVVIETPTYFTAKSLYCYVHVMASKMSLRRFFSLVDFCQYRFSRFGGNIAFT